MIRSSPPLIDVASEKYLRFEEEIERNLHAINFGRALFEARDEEFPQFSAKINNTEYVNLLVYVENAVVAEMLFGVTRLWERTRNSLSIPNFVKEFDWGSWDNGLKEDRWRSERLKAKCRLSEIVDTFVESDTWRSLRVSRAEGFAHSVLEAGERTKMNESRSAQQSDIDEAHNLAIEAWNCALMACRSIDNHSFPRNQERRLANIFYQSQPDLRPS